MASNLWRFLIVRNNIVFPSTAGSYNLKRIVWYTLCYANNLVFRTMVACLCGPCHRITSATIRLNLCSNFVDYVN